MKNRGWIVTAAGVGINLALGVLYAWSIFKGAIKASVESGGPFAWDLASLNDPYSIACLCFAFSMIPAGKLQDKIGPRFTAMIGGALVGIGLIIASTTAGYGAWVVGFGVLAGAGIGFGYSSATPPALKWFPPAKTGLVAGLVVAGFGLASVYIAPLGKFLIGSAGIQRAMLIFGVAFLVVVSLLSLLLVNPPAGFVPASPATPHAPAKPASPDVATAQMLRSPMAYLLWAIFFIGAGAGLMVIGSIGEMAKRAMGEAAFVAVAIMAIGNAGGRIVAGLLSDRLGRRPTLLIMLLFQAVMMFVAAPVVASEGAGALALVLLATCIGFNYGTNLSLFPSFTKDLWGLKNFGLNYGVIFTAWGVGGFVMSRLSQMLYASSKSYTLSFTIAGVMLIVGAALTFLLKPRPAAAAPAR